VLVVEAWVRWCANASGSQGSSETIVRYAAVQRRDVTLSLTCSAYSDVHFIHVSLKSQIIFPARPEIFHPKVIISKRPVAVLAQDLIVIMM
jgi:hypothetical protein